MLSYNQLSLPAVNSLKLLNPTFSVAIVLEIENNSHTLKSHLKKFYLIESGTSTGLLPTSFPGFSPTRSMGAGRREPWERGWPSPLQIF